jgi:serpin B
LLDVFARQQAKIEVDENGTRAAAVTSIEVGVTSIPPEPEIIVIDRPFIYLLRDRTSGVVLFSGRVVTL